MQPRGKEKGAVASRQHALPYGMLEPIDITMAMLLEGLGRQLIFPPTSTNEATRRRMATRNSLLLHRNVGGPARKGLRDRKLQGNCSSTLP